MKPCYSLACLAIIACGGGNTTTQPPPPPPAPAGAATFALNAGDNQSAVAGQAVFRRPSVIVKNSSGAGVSGVAVEFVVVAGGGSVTGAAPISDAQGVATVGSWLLGASGVQTLEARLSGFPVVRFSATIATPPVVVSIGPSGGTVEITTPGHPYQGLKLTIPGGAYSTSGTWQIGLATDAPTPTLPDGFTIAAPPLRIETAQLRANRLMTLRIPVTRVAGTVPVFILLDPSRNRMEMVPIIASDASSITVAGSHFNAGLLLGPTPVGALRSTTSGSAIPMGGYGYQLNALMDKLGFSPAELEAAASSIWPANEMGSYFYPEGHGPAIPLMSIMSRIQNRPIASSIKTIPGFGTLADTAALAALMLVGKRYKANTSNVLTDLAQAFGAIAPQARDELTSMNLRGMFLTSKLPPLMLFTEHLSDVPTGKVGRSVFAELTRMTSSSLWFSAPADPLASGELKLDPNGFFSRLIKNTVDGQSFNADAVLPIGGSFLFPFEQYLDVFPRMMDALGSTGAVRDAANLSFATDAGFPSVTLDVQGSTGTDWGKLEVSTVIRDTTAQVRAICEGCSNAIPKYSEPKQQTIATSNGTCSGGTLGFYGGGCGASALFDALGFGDMRATILTEILTPNSLGQVAAAYRIAVPVNYRLSKSIFRLLPDSQGTPPNTTLAFSAPVSPFPATGYVIDWDWGDGLPHTLSQNISSASHPFGTLGKFNVTATLKSSGTAPSPNQTLAVAKGVVTSGLPLWKFTTLDVAFETNSPSPLGTGTGSSPTNTWNFYFRLWSDIKNQVTQGGLIYIPSPMTLAGTVRQQGLWLVDGLSLTAANLNSSLQFPSTIIATPTGNTVRATVMVSALANRIADQPGFDETSTQLGSITGGTFSSLYWDWWTQYTSNSGLPLLWPIVAKTMNVTFGETQASGTLTFWIREIADGAKLPAPEAARWTIRVTFQATRVQ